MYGESSCSDAHPHASIRLTALIHSSIFRILSAGFSFRYTEKWLIFWMILWPAVGGGGPPIDKNVYVRVLNRGHDCGFTRPMWFFAIFGWLMMLLYDITLGLDKQRTSKQMPCKCHAPSCLLHIVSMRLRSIGIFSRFSAMAFDAEIRCPYLSTGDASHQNCLWEPISRQ